MYCVLFDISVSERSHKYGFGSFVVRVKLWKMDELLGTLNTTRTTRNKKFIYLLRATTNRDDEEAS